MEITYIQFNRYTVVDEKFMRNIIEYRVEQGMKFLSLNNQEELKSLHNIKLNKDLILETIYPDYYKALVILRLTNQEAVEKGFRIDYDFNVPELYKQMLIATWNKNL